MITKKYFGILFLIVAGLFLMSNANAIVRLYTEPYNSVLTTESELSKSITTIKNEMGVKSCYTQANWESKHCDYTYWCAMILPTTSTSVNSALWRECKDVSDATTASIEIKQFTPPKGVLYYVTTFITRVHYDYNDVGERWNDAITTTPDNYMTRHDIRSICPEGEMLGFNSVAGEYMCYLSKRACLDTTTSNLCTNAYTLYVIDKNQDGIITDAELIDGANFCADRPEPNYPDGNGICDMTQDLECADTCSTYTQQADGSYLCTTSGPNGLCDEWDLAVLYACWDLKTSQNAKICDTVESDVLCPNTYIPVCVDFDTADKTDDITFPNKCFAEGKGYTSSQYKDGACEPPVTQCYVVEDCPDADVCLGGSTAGIAKLCLDHMCSYTGACGNLACDTDADCADMNMPCIGVIPKCDGAVCVIEGKCVTQPVQKQTIWDLIQAIWTAFWNFVKSLIGV